MGDKIDLHLEKLTTQVFHGVVVVPLIIHNKVVHHKKFEDFLAEFPSGSYILESKNDFHYSMLIEVTMYNLINEIGVEQLAGYYGLTVVTTGEINSA